jgi:hypothetical protein
LSGWGAGSLVVEDTDGTARPRNITVINNKVTGLLPDGWISELGTELRGPFFYDNNLAGGYSAWTGNHKSTFTATNKTVTGDAAGMQAVRPWSLIGEPDAKNLIIPTVVASTTYTAKLGGVLDSWVHGKPFYMCGVLVLSENVSAGATASVTIKVYKNGVEVSSQAVILATERTHMAYFYNIADMVFGANDLVKVTATTNAAVDATSLTLRPMMVADGYYDDA